MLTKDSLNPHQQKYLEALITRYNQRTHKSKQFAQNNRQLLADNKFFLKFNLLLKEMHYTIVSNRSFGSKIWDIDNNEYIDFIMGFGVNLFGHNPLFIKEALTQQLEKGVQLGTQPELIGEVATGICELTGMERVAFSNTGTEAVMTAIRLARHVTGRSKIAIFSGSYHGHYNETLAKIEGQNGSLQTLPEFSGIPSNLTDNVLVLDYSNWRSLDIIKSFKDDLAAILVEPVQSGRLDLQPQEFLQEIRQITAELGIVLIFDEMVTGFRIHPGGAQEWFGVKADLATYGKIIGGGMPIGVIAGKAEYMNSIDGGMWNYGDLSYPQAKTTFFAGTFCKHPLAIATAKAVLDHLKSHSSDLQQQLNERTSNFVTRLNNYFARDGLPIRLACFGSLFGPAFSGDAESGDYTTLSLSLDLLYYHLLNRGVLLRGNGGFLSTAHTDADLDYVIGSVKDSVEELREGKFLPSL